jgi:hypothetical protein
MTIRIFVEYVATSAKAASFLSFRKARQNYVKLSINLTIRLIQSTGWFVNPSNSDDIGFLA